MKVEQQLEDFLKKYGSEYSKIAREYIEENFFTHLIYGFLPDVLAQVYAEFGILDKDRNLYQAFLDIIKQKHSLEKDIVEIGGGYLPILGEYIAKEQLKLGKGTITVYDPILVTTNSKYPNLKLVKEPFTMDTKLPGCDLLLGQMLCGATELTIQKACQEQIDFMIALCGCTHFSESDLFRNPYLAASPDRYHQYVYQQACELSKLKHMGEVAVEYYDEATMCPYPIFYNERNCKTKNKSK
ncbi:MAG: hypothetical protein KH135_00085 [Firmicutes bacterium]|nr:hypothetical protein [Bacillota bacterium]